LSNIVFSCIIGLFPISLKSDTLYLVLIK